MTKLINSVDKASCRFTEAEREKALQRPVMAFICQRHDLDGLQLAMRQALRKATCRVFAMQVQFDIGETIKLHFKHTCINCKFVHTFVKAVLTNQML